MTNANNNFMYGHECSNHITQIIKKTYPILTIYKSDWRKVFELKQKPEFNMK